MNHTTPRLALVVAFTNALVVLASGCYAPNAGAIQTQMLERCRMIPFGPLCAAGSDNPDGERRVFERFARDAVTTSETEACILAVDCSDERMATDANGARDEVLACNAADPAVQARRARTDTLDGACLGACDEALLDCGGGDDGVCTPDVVDACFDAFEACVDACPVASAADE